MPKQPAPEHFADYREQTRIKHRILEGYLPAYYQAMGHSFSRFAYVDGFAGRGHYIDNATGEQHPGSPLRALGLFQSRDNLRGRIDALFVEADKDLFGELETAIHSFTKAHSPAPSVAVRHGRFADEVPPYLSLLRQRNAGRLPPTFLFVDPCGVQGVAFEVICAVLREPGCELFLFLNSAGLRRIIGADRGKGQSPTLLQLFGDDRSVRRLLHRLSDVRNPTERENICLDEYRHSLKEATGADFFLPFPIESTDRMDTSHYLVHATKSPLGFKIMKHVMLEMHHDSGAGGILGHRQASARYASSEIRFDVFEMREQILCELERQPQQVEHFLKWVMRPTDFYSEKGYRREILELERLGKVRVFEDAGRTRPKPADRRLRAGQVTLGPSLWIARS